MDNKEKEKQEPILMEDVIEDDASVTVIDHILIRDKETGEILVNKRG